MDVLNKKGVSSVEFLVVSIIILISALSIFLLTSLGIIPVKDYEQVDVLNLEFLPYVNDGTLAIHDLQLCESIDFDKSCIIERNTFYVGETVSLRFVAETSALDGQVFLLENYRLRGPDGVVLLTGENEFPFESETSDDEQFVLFTDFFVLRDDFFTGEYTLEVVLKNPYLSKEITVLRRFDVG